MLLSLSDLFLLVFWGGASGLPVDRRTRRAARPGFRLTSLEPVSPWSVDLLSRLLCFWSGPPVSPQASTSSGLERSLSAYRGEGREGALQIRLGACSTDM